MTHETHEEPTPPVFAGRVDHGCGCPLGFIVGMGLVLLGARYYGWPYWLGVLLLLPAGVLSGAVVSLVFDAIEFCVSLAAYRTELSSYRRDHKERKR